MPQIYKPFDSDQYLQAFRIRQNTHALTSFTPEVLDAYTTVINKIEEDYINRLKSDNYANVIFFDAVSKVYEEIQEKKPSIAFICSEAILHLVAAPLLQTGIGFAEKGDYYLFAFYYDFTCGIVDTIKVIDEAEKVLQGRGEEMLDNIVIKFFKFTKDPLSSTVTDKATAFYRKEYVKYAALYKKDETGMLLIDSIIDELQEQATDRVKYPHGRFLSYQSSNVVLRGALFVNEIYQRFYETYVNTLSEAQAYQT